MGKILTILVTIIRFEENVLLKGIRESSGNFAPECVFDRISVKSDPLNVTNVGTCFEALTADTILVKFLFRVLELISGKCRSVIANEEVEKGHSFLLEQLSHLLLILTYVFRAGRCFFSDFRKINTLFVPIIATGNHRTLVDCTCRLLGQRSQLTLENITANLVEVSLRIPPIAYQWCSILTALECRSTVLWEMFFDSNRDYTVTTKSRYDLLSSKY